MKTRLLLTSLILSLIIFMTTGCTITRNNEPLIKEGKTVNINGAQSVHVNIDMGAGVLKTGGDASDLMDGKFIYNIKDWKPEVNYNVNDKSGSLTIKQPSLHNINLGNNRYEWNLNFNNNIPVDMNVNFGAGKGELDLSKLSIKNFQLKMGAGEIVLNLAGNYKQDVNVDFSGGVGSATIYLPKNIGVKVSVTRGLGKINANGFIVQDNNYVNEAYGKAKVSVIVNFKAGVGEVNLKLK